MKLLIDENLPKKLKSELTDFDAFTVHDMNWTGMKNGELLKSMIDHDFQVLLTFDKNLQYQQNFEKYPISVFILSAIDNTFSNLFPLLEIIKQQLQTEPKPGPTIIKE